MEIDDLAIMIKHGFDEVHEKMDRKFEEVNSRIDQTNQRLDETKQQLAETNQRLHVVERGQDDIILKLDYKAHRFEMKVLEDRVAALETKVGIGK